jgi:hypothetical protein
MKVKNIGGYNSTYKKKKDDHKKMGLWMFTNSEMNTSFLDSARYAAWSAIKKLGE